MRQRHLTQLRKKQDSRLFSPDFYFTTCFVTECVRMFQPFSCGHTDADDLQELDIVLFSRLV